MSKVYHFIFIFYVITSALLADVKSTNGTIHFDSNNDGSKEATLNTNGLGVGTTTPQANLHIQGNAIISQSLSIGTSSTSANLYLSGTYGFGIQTITSNTLLSGNSINLVDTTAGNIQVSLPNSDGLSGRTYTIKRQTTDHHVTVSCNTPIDAYQVIDMSSSNAESVTVMSNGSKWLITDSHQLSGNSLSSLGNLLFWIDASSSDMTLVNGNVAQINDQSGNDDHSTQGTTTSQPMLIADALKGKPVLRFDGDDFLTGDSIFSGNVFSIFAIMKSGTISGAEDMWLSTRVAANKGFELVIPSSGESRLRIFNSSGQTFQTSTGAPSSITNYNILTALYKSDGTEGYVNGAYPFTHAEGIDETTANLSIGKVIGASGAGQFDGDIAEIIIYNKTVSDTERLLIENYLRSKWTYRDRRV